MFGSALEWLVQHESISSGIFHKQVYGYHHGLNNLHRNILNNLHRNIFLSILTNNFVLHSVFCPINSPIKIIFPRKKVSQSITKVLAAHSRWHMANSLQNTDKKIFLFWNDSEHGDTPKSCYQNMPQGISLLICRQLDRFAIKHSQTQNNGLPFYVHCKRLIRSLFHKKMEPRHEKTNKMTCTHNEDSDQPGHPPSLLCALYE